MSVPRERVIPALPFVAAGRLVPSPLQFLTTGEDNLRLIVINSLAGVRVAVQGRRLDENTKIHVFGFDLAATNDRMPTQRDFPLGVGGVLNLTVYVSAGQPHIGETYVILQLIRGTTGGTFVVGTLLAGYITAAQALGFPGSPIHYSLEGDGALKEMVGTQPAAGAEVSEAVPTGARWQIMSLLVGLTASADVAQRLPHFIVQSDLSNFTFLAGTNTHVASEVRWYHLIPGGPLAVSSLGDTMVITAPAPLILSAGMRIVTSTSNIQAADQYSSPRMLIREWLEVE